MMKATVVRKEIDGFAAFLPRIREMDSVEFDEELHRRLARIEEMARAVPEERPALMKYCFDACSAELEKGRILRHTRQKPYGYAGDYQVIDWMFQGFVGNSGEEWDTWYQRQHATEAVRNRKSYFKNLVQAELETDPSLSILNLACGPCRDACEAVVEAGPTNGMSVHCVDIDQRALDYGQAVADEYGVSRALRFERRNVMRMRSNGEHTLVWCSGLFDYLNDRQATFLLKRMWQMTAGGGGRW